MRNKFRNRLFVLEIDYEQLNAFLGKEKNEILFLMGREPDEEVENECIYILKRYIMGVFAKRLYLYFSKDRLYGYYIGTL